VKRFRLGRRPVAALALACILLVSGLGYLYYTGVGYRYFAETKVRKDLVGVLTVEGPILSSQTASGYTNIINQALLNESVKAVVLRVDSPGGYADYIEQVYLDVLELKEKKPLVASVVSALSGGYYISVAADYIYVHPASTVGNIGVIGEGPPTLIPSEIVMETGAYKVTGFSKLLFPFNLTHALDSFVSAVEAGRGGRLKLSSTQLRRGMIYFGSEAVAAGLADEIGSLQKAVERVASEAGLVEYDVVGLNQLFKAGSHSLSSYNETTVEWRDLTVETLNRLHPPPAVYHLYLPPRTLAPGIHTLESTAEAEPVNVSAEKVERGAVLVDLSHGNRVSTWELDILAAELAMRNMTLAFVETWDEVESALGNSSALIVAAPTEPYSSEEGERIEEFVDDGRMLLMFFDPASEYLEIPALNGPINSLANRFGLHFAKGYLYNEEEHYGFYRNIYISSFASNNLTRGLSSVVFFTAAHIYTDDGAAWASHETFSSTAERTGNYTVMAFMKGNGTVAAFGDLTFLMEPYCYLEDNYRLVLNLVEAIAGVEVPIEAPHPAP
jgi:protease-4